MFGKMLDILVRFLFVLNGVIYAALASASCSSFLKLVVYVFVAAGWFLAALEWGKKC